MSGLVIHKAGPLVGGVQYCIRCGEVLTDYRGAMVPEEDANKPLRGWAEGAHVERSTAGNPRYSGVTLSDPTCEEQPVDSVEELGLL